MRVGVYTDGFNLYYGAKFIMGGSGRPGWRWLDLRQLSKGLVAQHSTRRDPAIDRVVYCTARISGASNPSGSRDQDTYLRALKNHNSVDLCEEGVYVNRVAAAPLAKRDPKGRPVLATAFPSGGRPRSEAFTKTERVRRTAKRDWSRHGLDSRAEQSPVSR